MSTFDYDKAWKHVTSLQEKGLPRDALIQVEEILANATREQVSQHIVKATYTRLTLEGSINPTKTLESLQEVEKQLDTYDGTTRALLASYLSSAYYLEYQAKRWQIRNRTAVDGELPSDPATWTSKHYYHKIHDLHQVALEDPAVLNKPLEDYEAIVAPLDVRGAELTPTLFLLVGERASTFYASAQDMVVSNTADYQWSDPVLMASSARFVTLEIPSSSDQVRAVAMRTLQSLERYAIENDHTLPQSYLELNRIKAVYAAGQVADQDVAYNRALKRLIDNAPPYVASQAMLLSAGLLGSEVLGKKVATLEKLIKEYDKDLPAVSTAQNLLKSLHLPTLRGRMRRAVYPNRPFTIKLEHKNISTCKYTIYRSSYTTRDNLKSWDQQDAFLEAIRGGEAVAQGAIALTSGPGYEQLTSSVEVQGLPAGQYEVVFDTFGPKAQDAGTSYASMDVTTLAMQTINTGKEAYGMITDRWTGKPLPGVKVDFFTNTYNRTKRQSERLLHTSIQSDKAGIARVKQGGNYFTTLSYQDEEYRPGGSINTYINPPGEPNDQVSVMTDRSIYRPGQLLHYKVLAVDVSRSDKQVYTRKKITVTILDANRKELYSRDLTTNTFGSASGTFALPANGLPGSYSINASVKQTTARGSRTIRVEAYKRPKYQVQLAAPSDRRVLGDSISVNGSAIALAGPAVSNAKVRYTVNRSTYWPWWRRSYQGRYFNSQSATIIKSGETATKEDGSFTFDFVAAYPNNAGDQYFRYEVTVDVTDQTGESRSATTTYSLNQKAVSLSANVADLLVADSSFSVAIKAENFANTPQEVSGNIMVHRLVELTSYQYDEQPSSGNYREPILQQHYASWKVDREVVSQSFDTQKEQSPTFEGLAPGTYQLQVVSSVADTFEHFFVVIDYNGRDHSPAHLLYNHLDQPSYQPGETATLSIAASDDVETYILVERMDKTTTQWMPLRGKARTLEIDVQEKDRGSIFYQILCVSNNQYFVKNGVIPVPYDNKQLDVQLKTWRDKVLPGAKETWTLHIAGPQGDQVSAEVLAAMYDASLDQFTKHDWQTSYWSNRYSRMRCSVLDFGQANMQSKSGSWTVDFGAVDAYRFPKFSWGERRYDLLNYESNAVRKRMMSSGAPAPESAEMLSVSADEAAPPRTAEPPQPPTDDVVEGNVPAPAPVIRSDFRETVFFYPDLRTDKEGSVSFTFTMSEALTKWRSMFFAHTADVKTGYEEQVVQTQKDLMIVGNSPRFLRAGDQIALSGKVSNLSESPITGEASIRLRSAVTDEPLDFIKTSSKQVFSLDQGQSTTLAWSIDIPRDYVEPVIYELVATSGKHSDGERHLLPTVTNRKLLTETLPMYVSAGSDRTFVFERLKEVASPTLSHQQYTVEFTSNPIWYVVQALPTLEPKSFETSDYVAQRLYASVVGGHIVQLSPRIKQVFDQWQLAGSDALLSNLEKNEELKSTILSETPWVRDAADEGLQKRLIAAFFDVNALSNQHQAALQKLQERQLANGGWAWCSGGRSSYQTTQRILLIMGQLNALSLLDDNTQLARMINDANQYHDEEMKRLYDKMRRQKDFDPENNYLSGAAVRYMQVQKLLDRQEHGVAAEAYTFYLEQAKKYWLSRPLSEQAIIGQVLLHSGDKDTAEAIVESLQQRSVTDSEMGMRWVERGYQWSFLPIERQTEMIEFFKVMDKEEEVNQLILHLLQLKKTNRWPTNAGTAAAVHSFLTLQTEDGGMEGLAVEPVQIQVGSQRLPTTNLEAGTLYTKQSFTDVQSSMADVRVTNSNKVVAWGAAYWQYWEDLDKITSFDNTPLKVSKTYYQGMDTDRGELLKPIGNGQGLTKGDKLVTRVIIESDRPMSFVHLEDMRPAGVEPVDVLSRYKYQDGLSYYHATRDLSTDFYIDYLPTGKYVLEYDVFVSHTGSFSTGIATLQSYYAPEYSSHSKGGRLEVQ